LTTEGPPEAFAVEADRVQPAVDAYASFLNGLAYPIQVLVRALPIDLASYARRLEDRAVDLPPTLAASARADALWARQTGPDLGLLDRRAFLVLPAEALPDGDLIRRLGSARIRFGRWFGAAGWRQNGQRAIRAGPRQGHFRPATLGCTRLTPLRLTCLARRPHSFVVSGSTSIL